MTDSPTLIVGSGAMACLFAARLAPHGPVQMLASWPEAIEAIRREGVLLETAGRLHSAHVSIDEQVELGAFDSALVLVKSWQTAAVAPRLAAALSPEAVALSLQNGLGSDRVLRQQLGPERLAVGITTYGASLDGPGQVVAGGEGRIEVGRQPRLGPLIERLRTAGFQVVEHDDIDSLIWGKLVINAGINPVSALLEVANGFLAEDASARAAMAAAAVEAATVADALGIELPFSDPAEACLQVATRTANNRSSMLQDLRRGAPTEVDAINGAITQAGERAGVSTPVNQLLWRLMRAAVGAA